MRIRALLLAAVTAAAFAAPASAATGDLLVRVRGLGVLPDASGTVTLSGTSIGGVSVTDSVVPEVDFTYFFANNWAAELIAGTTQNSVHNPTAGDIGSVWLLPPTLTVQYHFMPDNPNCRPYVGAGINYTFFYSPHSPLPGIHYSDNVGFALQAGVDVPFGDSGYFFNADVKKIFLSTDVTAVGGAVKANNVALDPWLIGVGVGYRF